MNIGGSIRVNPLGLALLAFFALALLWWNFGGGGGGDSGEATVSMKQLLAVCIEAAKRGGKEVKKIREEVRLNFCT